jgi:hypothetical protein
MRRHSTDLVGLMFGSAFLIAGVGFLVRETTDTVVNFAWLAGVGLMLLGAIALVATVARNIRHGDDDDRHDHTYEHDYADRWQQAYVGYGVAGLPETSAAEADAPTTQVPTSDE